MHIEEDKILGIYIDSLFSSEKCQQFYVLNFTYEHRGLLNERKRSVEETW